MEPKKEHPEAAEHAGAEVGTERQDPGASTRQLGEQEGQEASDVEEIARQQGTSQRGYTADGPQENRPAQFDPKHPGGRPEGDPRR